MRLLQLLHHWFSIYFFKYLNFFFKIENKDNNNLKKQKQFDRIRIENRKQILKSTTSFQPTEKWSKVKQKIFVSFFVSIRFLQGNGTTIVPKNYANFASTMISCPFPPKIFTFCHFTILSSLENGHLQIYSYCVHVKTMTMLDKNIRDLVGRNCYNLFIASHCPYSKRLQFMLTRMTFVSSMFFL